jgi:hypothetical protein
MRVLSLIGVAALSAVLVSAKAQAALVNGSFETPVATDGGFLNFNTGNDVGGWTVAGPQASIVSGLFTQNGFSFPAEDGKQWLDLTGLSSNTSEGVQQSVGTVAGSGYSLSFWVGNIVNPGGIFGTTSTVNVVINGSPVFSAVNSDGAGTSTQNWKQFTVPFNATGPTTTIEFLNADPASDNSNGLDNVTLAGATAVVPLPSALWATLAALPFLAVVQWVGRRRVTATV